MLSDSVRVLVNTGVIAESVGCIVVVFDVGFTGAVCVELGPFPIIGFDVGFCVGFAVGFDVGFTVAFCVGLGADLGVGFGVESSVGFDVGFDVGFAVGFGVGDGDGQKLNFSVCHEQFCGSNI